MRCSFAHNYQVKEQAQLPAAGGGRVYYYPGARQKGGEGGALIEVQPLSAPSWIGNFAIGYRSGLALTDVSSCPNPDEICVVSSGTAYVVHVNDPVQWQSLPCFPVTQMVEVPAWNLMIFADFTSLVAFGAKGINWMAPHLASDGLKILGIEARWLRLSVWRAERRAEVEIHIDLQSGLEEFGGWQTE